MKKLLVSFLMGCLALGMVACGSNADNAPAGENDVVVDNQVEPETELETEPATEPVVEPETESATEAETEPEVPVEEKVTYTYTDLSQTMYAKRDVNVRDLPSVDGNKVEGLSLGEEVTVTGKCNETGWYRISYGGKTAYVSNNYLVSEKPVPQEPVAQAPVEETPAEPEVVLMNSPWELNTPTYSMELGCMVFFNVVGDEEGYMIASYNASQILRWHSGKENGACYNVTIPQGTFAEGEINMVLVYIQ